MTVKRKEQAGYREKVAQENEVRVSESRETAESPPAGPSHLTRRAFIGVATVSVAALATRSFPQGMLPTAAAQKGGGAVTRNPLRIPPPASPANPTLRAAPGRVDLGGGKFSSVLGYQLPNDTTIYFPGPTFRADSGSSVNIYFSNGLAEQTTIHWHGMIVPGGATDGHLRYPVAPGGTYNYNFPIIQRACLNWYHPHPHMLTGKQVNLGLAGAFIINDDVEATLGLPSGAYEVPLIIRDANLDNAGNLTYNPTSSGFFGKTPLVNGTLNPTLNVGTAVYRLRVLNGANARVFRLALSNGAPFTVIGNDGGLLEFPAQVTQIEFGPGERLDLLVNFSGLSGGNRLMLQDLDARWDLLEFVGTGDSGPGYTLPAQLTTIEPLVSPTSVTRSFSFEGMSKINGKEYDLNRIDFQVPFGVTERWRFTTKGNAPHPVHVHGASFQVVSRSGGRGRLFPWERGWKDTVLLHDRETVDILIRFDGKSGSVEYKGLYLLHCHQLEHEDHGMMSNFEVV